MAKYKVVTQKPAGVTFDLADGQYLLEKESLDSIDAEIIEIDASTEDEFIASAKDADAVIARGRPITKKIIDALENCKVISLGSVGADTVDVNAATAKGIPVTNVPDTFIEEVADHTMMLLLASYRRLNIMDQMVRENRWAEGRPLLSEFPRLWGQTLGFIAFGHVAKAVSIRAKAFGLRLIAFDPYIEELSMTECGVQPISTLEEMLSMSDIVSMHDPSTEDAFHLMSEPQFKSMKPTALFINNGRGPTVEEEALIKPIIGSLIAVVDVIHAHQVHVFFRAHLENLKFGSGKESLDVRMFKLSEIPWEQMAFKTGTIALKAQINKAEDDWTPVYETLP